MWSTGDIIWIVLGIVVAIVAAILVMRYVKKESVDLTPYYMRKPGRTVPGNPYKFEWKDGRYVTAK